MFFLSHSAKTTLKCIVDIYPMLLIPSFISVHPRLHKTVRLFRVLSYAASLLQLTNEFANHSTFLITVHIHRTVFFVVRESFYCHKDLAHSLRSCFEFVHRQVRALCFSSVSCSFLYFLRGSHIHVCL